MVEVKKVILDSGVEYIIVDEIEIENKKYVYLANENDEKDFCIRKSIIENNEEFFVGLDSKEEFEKALIIFTKKNNL